MTSSKFFDVPPTIGDRISHILTAVNNIRQILTGQTRESFANNLEKRLAVERLLEVISEASRFIPPDVRSQETSINWRRLADLGNRLRHAYHRTDADLMWAMVENDLELLKVGTERIARELDGPKSDDDGSR
jgi:uncharacterized protein with HEPN domain